MMLLPDMAGEVGIASGRMLAVHSPGPSIRLKAEDNSFNDNRRWVVFASDGNIYIADTASTIILDPVDPDGITYYWYDYGNPATFTGGIDLRYTSGAYISVVENPNFEFPPHGIMCVSGRLDRLNFPWGIAYYTIYSSISAPVKLQWDTSLSGSFPFELWTSPTISFILTSFGLLEISTLYIQLDNSGVENGVLSFYSSSNELPTVEGNEAYSSLLAKGWTITL